MSKTKASFATSLVLKLFFAGTWLGTVSWCLPSQAELLLEEPSIEMEADTETVRLVEQAHEFINQYRVDRNLPPLSLNAHISQQAESHSQNMSDGVVRFSHEGFQNRVEALESQIIYLRAAENVAYNQGYQDPVQEAVAGWIDSENHHRHIVGDFNLTGIGVAKNERGEYYFTQIFIKD